MKYVLSILLLGFMLVLAACSSQAETPLTLQSEELSTLDSSTSTTIAFYQGNPEEGGTLVSEYIFTKDKSQESREAFMSAREAAISAGADFVLMSKGDKQFVKAISELGLKRSFRKGLRGSSKDSETRNFYNTLADGAEITVELFTADPSSSSAVASYSMTKGSLSRESKSAQRAELKNALETANISFQDVTHKRLSSGDQSIVIESKQKRGSKRDFRKNGSTD